MRRITAIFITLAMVISLFNVALAEESFYHDLEGEWQVDFFNNADDKTPAKGGTVKVPGALELQGYGYPGYYYEEQAFWGMPEDDGVKTKAVYTYKFNSTNEGKAYLVFDNVKDILDLTFNGKKYKTSYNAEIGTVFEIELKDGENTIEASVTRDNSGINKADNFALSGIVGKVYVTDRAPYGESISKEVGLKDGLINIDGKETVIYAVRYTPTAPSTGDAIEEAQMDEDIALIKEYGFNTVLTSAAPDHFYKKAKEAGLYIIDEANVYLGSADRDRDSAKGRIEEMVKRHRQYDNIIIWSLGSASGNIDQSLKKAVSDLDKRPILQDMNISEFEVFGATGGFSDWYNTLGEGNIGGVIKEFADKELSYQRHIYDLETKDKITGDTYAVSGEIKGYLGDDMLGEGEFEINTQPCGEFTIETYISSPAGNRVLFESGDVKLSVRDGRFVANIGGSEISTSTSGGRLALVYANGEAQLFKEAAFSANGRAEGKIGEKAKIGQGDGGSAIKYIKVYSKALTLDDLLEENEKPDTWIDFSDITVIKDNSYSFLATGGDFGDEPNSYYKSLKGLFTSEREPHPEAYEIKTILENSVKEPFMVSGMFGDVPMMASSEMGSGKAYIKSKGAEAVISYNGAIESFKVGGKEKLTAPLLPITARDETVSEYERGVYFDEVSFTTKTFELIEGGVRIELIARSGAVLNIEYTMTEDDVLHVSQQAHFPQSMERPSFIGFEGLGDYDKAAWTGFGFDSSYPDRRRAGNYGEFEAEIKDLSDNYHLWGENGNRDAFVFTVSKGENALTFSSPQGLECRAIPDGNGAASLRVGGYIAGLSEIEKYKLNNSYYGFSFEMSDKGQMADILSDTNFIYIDGARFTDFAPGVYEYVYRTDTAPKVEVVGLSKAEYFDDRCELEGGKYTIYFAPKDIYLSDVEEMSGTGEIAKDKSLSGGDIRLSGDMFSGQGDKLYEKGISMKAGSKITYDVSGFSDHTLSLVLGKNGADMFGGGWFNRGMFDAEAKVSIYLDGVLSEEIGGISMRSGRRELSIDISGAKELVIEVTGTGREDTAEFEDAVLADAKLTPKGPIVLNAEKKGGKAVITLLNTDSDALDVVLSATDGGTVTSVGAKIAKGAYRTLTLDNVADGATVEAVFKDNRIEIE